MNGENNQQRMATPAIKKSAPILIIIFSILLLIDGVLLVLGTIPAFLIGGILMGGLIGIIGVGKIVAATGLRKMKKWAIYVIFGITVIGILLLVYNFFNKSANLKDSLSILLNIVVLIYFWSIKNKFA